MSESAGRIYGINGPVLRVRGYGNFRMSEMVSVGNDRLIGEVISISREEAIIQVFEETTGLKPKDLVYASGAPLSVTLGPGIIKNIFDGIQRPLAAIQAQTGAFIGRGARVASLDEEKLWDVKILVKVGDKVSGGAIIAETQETPVVVHRVLLPPDVSGEVVSVKPDGQYKITDTIITVRTKDSIEKPVCMMQKWPIRVRRPVNNYMMVSRPLITGQRVVDSLFPIAKGGMAALPGGFGTGKTMMQHQLAKWSDADIIIYIGCGERGNEMTQVLEDFTKLQDPRTGAFLMDRTVLIANTSNMPVAAREASIYTGITMAEYFRDMGYDVAIFADSTSRWAEALRELSGRLEEMPAEEGFPAYLASRLASFYERAGCCEALCGKNGSVTIIGAVSPQGADFSEPVTQNTKRFVRCFWTLDRNLAYARHFPAVQWLTSYSEYVTNLADWYNENVGEQFLSHRAEILKLLNEESELNEIVKLIGADVLPDTQKVVLEAARVVRLGFVQQNAYHSYDTYVPFEKQLKMMDIMLYLYDKCTRLVAAGHPMSSLKANGIFDKVVAIKYDVSNDNLAALDEYKKLIDEFYEDVLAN
ncbi:MAG: V-type ATP synthase subunit A [Clostridiales bacterium]|nr:V-type ATP synthase subunit A [Clostridiales bacterium]